MTTASRKGKDGKTGVNFSANDFWRETGTGKAGERTGKVRVNGKGMGKVKGKVYEDKHNNKHN
jgi:hypothetical protein